MNETAQAPAADAGAPRIEDIIRKYIELRDAEDKLKADMKAALEPIQKAMSTIESYFMDLSAKTGQTSFGAGDGIAFLATEAHCGVEDFDAVVKFAQENDMWRMLTKGVSKTVVKEYLDEHSQLPPGVKWSTHKVVRIRRK